MADSGVKKLRRQIIVEMTKPKGKLFPLLSWLIRLLQWKWWRGQSWFKVPSHARVRFFDSKHQVWWVYEASGTKVKLIGYDRAMTVAKVTATYEFYITPEAKKQLVININKSIDKPYGKLQLVGLGIVRLLRLFAIKISNPFSDGKKTEVCVETVYWVLWEEESFRSILSRYEPDTLDLCDLIAILEELKNVDSTLTGQLSKFAN